MRLLLWWLVGNFRMSRVAIFTVPADNLFVVPAETTVFKIAADPRVG